MNKRILKEYRRRRSESVRIATLYRLTYGTHSAQNALREARIVDEWEQHENAGHVRLRIVEDEYADIGNLEGDTFNPKANPDISPAKLERERAAFIERINRDGVVGVIGEYFDGEDWQQADSCWGFVGDDWKESGYDIDIMSQTLEAFEKTKYCETCGRPKLKRAK